MPKFERGSYEPDDVRVFDGGADDDDAEGSHLPMVIVISLLVLAAFGGVVWLAYNNGVAKGRADVPPRIVAQNTDTPAAVPDSSEAPAPKVIKVYQQPAGPEDDTSQEPAMNKPAAATPVIHPAPPEAKPVAVQPKPTAVVAEETKKPVVLPAAVTQTAPTPAKVTPKPATPPATAPAVATAPPTALTTPAKAAVAVPPPAPVKTAAAKTVAAAPSQPLAPLCCRLGRINPKPTPAPPGSASFPADEAGTGHVRPEPCRGRIIPRAAAGRLRVIRAARRNAVPRRNWTRRRPGN